MRDDILLVVPYNDLEAKTIIDLARENNVPVLVSNQRWGASWDGLEPEIKEVLKQSTEVRKNTYVIGNPMIGGGSKTVTSHYPFKREDGELVKSELCQARYFDHIYGVELQGKTLGHNIDHHSYQNDDRSNSLSSLEQFANLIGVELTPKQLMISANDKAYIPGMLEMANQLFLSEEETKKMIDEIRLEEREIQGITPEMEKQAEEAINNREKIGDLTIVHCEHSKTAPICDRLFSQYDNMIVISKDGEYNFFGNSKLCETLQEKFGGWAGNTKELENTYWGVGKPSEEWPNPKYPNNELEILDALKPNKNKIQNIVKSFDDIKDNLSKQNDNQKNIEK